MIKASGKIRGYWVWDEYRSTQTQSWLSQSTWHWIWNCIYLMPILLTIMNFIQCQLYWSSTQPAILVLRRTQLSLRAYLRIWTQWAVRTVEGGRWGPPFFNPHLASRMQPLRCCRGQWLTSVSEVALLLAVQRIIGLCPSMSPLLPPLEY